MVIHLMLDKINKILEVAKKQHWAIKEQATAPDVKQKIPEVTINCSLS